jgi:hypothetical protein
MMEGRRADWMSIVFQGLFGAFLGSLAGGLLVMNRVTRFMASDAESSMIMVAGCVLAGAGLFMKHGDSLLVSTRTIPAMPIRHTRLSMLLAFTLIVIGGATVFFGIGRYICLRNEDQSNGSEHSEQHEHFGR